MLEYAQYSVDLPWIVSHRKHPPVSYVEIIEGVSLIRTGPQHDPRVLISTLQKSIMRNRASLAGYAAGELLRSGYAAWAGFDDDEIMCYSGHSSKSMVVKYAGKARQIMRAEQAAMKRGGGGGQNGNGT